MGCERFAVVGLGFGVAAGIEAEIAPQRVGVGEERMPEAGVGGLQSGNAGAEPVLGVGEAAEAVEGVAPVDGDFAFAAVAYALRQARGSLMAFAEETLGAGIVPGLECALGEDAALRGFPGIAAEVHDHEEKEDGDGDQVPHEGDYRDSGSGMHTAGQKGDRPIFRKGGEKSVRPRFAV